MDTGLPDGFERETGLPNLSISVDKRLLETWLNHHGLGIAELRRSGRDALHLEARRQAALFLRRRGWSYPAIGVHLERDHASIQNLVKGRARTSGRASVNGA